MAGGPAIHTPTHEALSDVREALLSALRSMVDSDFTAVDLPWEVRVEAGAIVEDMLDLQSTVGYYLGE